MPYSTKLVVLLAALVISQCSMTSSFATQEQDNLLGNPSFEDSTESPEPWFFPAVSDQFELKLDSADNSDGKVSALVDTTNSDGRGNRFAMLNQNIDPASLRGKRVRFRAAVRIQSESSNGRAQLWLRVDTEAGRIGAFDNMDSRAITSGEWQHYDIVVDVDGDAVRLVVGMLVFGKTKAWLDDTSLVVVDESEATTGKSLAKSKDSTQGNRGTASRISIPQQPFFNGWLALAALVLVMFFVGQLPNHFIQRFCLRFTAVYFVVYHMPYLFVSIWQGINSTLMKTGMDVETSTAWLANFNKKFTDYKQDSISWVNDNWLKNEPIEFFISGSGDKTSDFVYLLICFCAALAIATVWSIALASVHKNQIALRDLTRTYLRYVLAFTMLVYGLAKTGFIQTQFASGGMPTEFQLNRTYGESSPMGLVWTFMAASPAYTFFAGLGEVAGGVLLVFRRTATLGALVTFGVMLNVVMLNFCYDVPVKQYSFHLLIMALLIAAPDFGRLTNVLLFNRPTESSNLLVAPWLTNKPLIWGHRVVKLIILSVVVFIPILEKAKQEIEHEHHERSASKHLLMNRGFRWINELPYNR